jgi:hypothetical protein
MNEGIIEQTSKQSDWNKRPNEVVASSEAKKGAKKVNIPGRGN